MQLAWLWDFVRSPDTFTDELNWLFHRSIVFLKQSTKSTKYKQPMTIGRKLNARNSYPPGNQRIICWPDHVLIRTEIKFMFIHKLFVSFINPPCLPPCLSAHKRYNPWYRECDVIHSVYLYIRCCVTPLPHLAFSLALFHIWIHLFRSPSKYFG